MRKGKTMDMEKTNNKDTLEIKEEKSTMLAVRDNMGDKNKEKQSELTYGLSGKEYNKMKKSKMPIIILAIAVVAIIGVVVFFINFKPSKESKDNNPGKPTGTEDPTSNPAVTSSDEPTETPSITPTEKLVKIPDLALDVYVALQSDDYEYVEISDYIIDAQLSPDMKQCVYLADNNKLYYAKTDNTSIEEITTDCTSIEKVTDLGVIYSDKNEKAHRYMFGKKSDMTLGPLDECCIADSNLNVAWTSFWEDQNIYLLKESSDEIEIISTYQFSCYVSDISDDGNIVYWDVYDMNGDTSIITGVGISPISESALGGFIDGASVSVSGGSSERVPKEYIYEYKNGNINIKVELNNTSSWDYEPIGCHTRLNGSDSFTYVYNDFMYELDIINESGKVINYKLENPISEYICTKNGRFEYDKSLRYEGLYVNVQEERPNRRVINNISYLNPYGYRFDLLSDVLDYVIFDEYIYYIDSNGKLLRSKILGYKLSEPELIDDGYIHEILSDLCTNGYVYYSKGTHEAYEDKKSEGELWVYNEASGSKRAEEEVFFSMNDIRYWDHENVNEDGKTVYFFKNVEYNSASKNEAKGDLYAYTYGDNKAMLIASNVVLGSVKGGSQHIMRIKDNVCIYNRYSDLPGIGLKSEWICNRYTGENMSFLVAINDEISGNNRLFIRSSK